MYVPKSIEIIQKRKTESTAEESRRIEKMVGMMQKKNNIKRIC